MLHRRENNAQMKSAKVGQRFCSVVFGSNSNLTALLGASGVIVEKIALPVWLRDLEASGSLIVYDTCHCAPCSLGLSLSDGITTWLWIPPNFCGPVSTTMAATRHASYCLVLPASGRNVTSAEGPPQLGWSSLKAPPRKAIIKSGISGYLARRYTKYLRQKMADDDDVSPPRSSHASPFFCGSWILNQYSVQF